MKENFDKLKIGDKFFNSRLMLGTGKYKTTTDAVNSIESSDCEIVTVAIRRLPTNLKDDTTSFLSFRLEETLVITKYSRITNCGRSDTNGVFRDMN
jgi:thiazole synthase ThiGH ThiG subunit